MVALWRCRAKGCDFTYRDPIGHASVVHKCPKRDGVYTYCRRVKSGGNR